MTPAQDREAKAKGKGRTTPSGIDWPPLGERHAEKRVNGQSRAAIHVTWTCELALSMGVRRAHQLQVSQDLSKNLGAVWAATPRGQSQPLLGKVVFGTLPLGNSGVRVPAVLTYVGSSGSGGGD